MRVLVCGKSQEDSRVFSTGSLRILGIQLKNVLQWYSFANLCDGCYTAKCSKNNINPVCLPLFKWNSDHLGHTSLPMSCAAANVHCLSQIETSELFLSLRSCPSLVTRFSASQWVWCLTLPRGQPILIHPKLMADWSWIWAASRWFTCTSSSCLCWWVCGWRNNLFGL